MNGAGLLATLAALATQSPGTLGPDGRGHGGTVLSKGALPGIGEPQSTRGRSENPSADLRGSDCYFDTSPTVFQGLEFT